MTFEQNTYGMWQSQDSMALCFREIPQVIIARNWGHDSCYNVLGDAQIEVEQLEFAARVDFGPARTTSFSTSTKWSGNSYRYGIYWIKDEIDGGLNTRRVAIFEVNGSGTFLYIWAQADAVLLWNRIITNVPAPNLWDLIHGIVGTMRKAESRERNRLYGQFAAGKLKRKKVRGKESYRITEEPSALTTCYA